MKSLHARLDHQKEEVLKVTETFGQFRGMCFAKVQSYDRFKKWLKDVTGDENFGLRPKLNLNSYQTLGDQLVDAFLRKVATLEAQKDSLSERIDSLEWTLSHSQEKEQAQALAIVQACQ